MEDLSLVDVVGTSQGIQPGEDCVGLNGIRGTLVRRDCGGAW